MLIGILATTLAGLLTGVAKWTPQSYSLGDLAATAGKLDIAAALRIGFVEIVFVFLFIDLFDNIGTLVAVGKKANLFDQVGQIPRINRILFSDAIATIVGALSGTSTVVSYIESAAGVAAGGRTGVTAIVTGLLFVLALFIAPVVGAIPAAATAPALIIVGSMMVSVVERDRLARSRSGHPGLPHHDDHPADLQHRQRPGLRLHRLQPAEDRCAANSAK